MSRVLVHPLKIWRLSDLASFLITNVKSQRPFQTTLLLKQAYHRQDMFHSLIELIRKLFRPPIGTGRMLGIVLLCAFPKSACVSHVPSVSKEEIGDMLCSQQYVYRDSCKK